MSSPAFKINLGAIDEPYTATLVDADGQVPDLTDASIQLVITQIGATLPKVDAAATILGNPINGQVTYTFIPADVDVVGMFTAVWEVTFQDLTTRKYPSDNVDLIEIVTGPNIPYHLMGSCAPWTTVQEVRLVCAGGLALSGAEHYVPDEIVQANINVATDLLYNLSGMQFTGECVEILRPCGESNCYRHRWSLFPSPLDESALPARTCGCNRLKKVDLGAWPVTNIVYVKVDGELIDAATYRLDANRFLVRLDGAGPSFTNVGWPTCQHLDRPGTEEGTFEVMVEYGVPVPDAGRYSAARLACELTKASAGQACQIPGRVTSVNRQQLSFTMINPSMLDNGLTGLYEVDLFIMAYNPNKQRGHTVVWSPDLSPGSYRPGQ